MKEKTMSACPYPQVVNDPTSGKLGLNQQYILWHEGYEAHKLELLTKTKCIDNYMRELCSEVKKIKVMKRKLEKQI
jgi:hypothetical protein